MADIIFPGEAPQENLGVTRLPENTDLSIWRGDTQEYIIAFTDDQGVAIDLTGTTPAASIKQSFNSSAKYDFVCTVQNTNEVRIYMSAALCKTIPAGDYIWNFQITDSAGDVRTYLAGDVTVYAEVD